MNYNGPIPHIDLWEGISQEEFNSLEQNNWSLRNETIKYCENDCIVLYEILAKFNTKVFNEWKTNIHKYPTLSSLTLGIFRTNFMEDNVIPRITGKIRKDIANAFTGGHTDVFIPYGENLNHYDVNSLYPSMMKSFDMPVGPIHYFEGNILNFSTEPFGFFEVEIECPDDMERPLLLTRVETNSGTRTMAPTGFWRDWIFSEEMFKYIEYGYKFKIIKGLLDKF